jgi:hypothetical protein
VSEETKGYPVVMENLDGPTAGVRTWTYFPSKEEFDTWYKGNMKDGTQKPLREVYTIVAQGVSTKEAVEICSTPVNRVLGAVGYVEEMLEALGPELGAELAPLATGLILRR